LSRNHSCNRVKVGIHMRDNNFQSFSHRYASSRSPDFIILDDLLPEAFTIYD
jgi:hypothetical protein